MGIKLVEEVMDWCPDDVTPAQRWCLTVLARDANDATRETWHGPEHPEILRRVRMTPKRWEATRSALLKRGLIEVVSGGFRGKTVRYRIASMFAPCVIQDWRKTPEERGAFGGYAAKTDQKDPRAAGGNELGSPPGTEGLSSESPSQNGGQSAERPPQNGGPTPLSPPLQSLSSSPAAAPDATKAPATPNDEREMTSPDGEQLVAAAYVEAIGRPVSPTTRNKIQKQAAELLAAGFPAPWLADRARELAARGWTDLAQHCDRSTVPIQAKATATKADWCGHCFDPNNRMVKDPARDNELVDCPQCHPAAVARRRRATEGAAA